MFPSSWSWGKNNINVSFEEYKGKDYLKANIYKLRVSYDQCDSLDADETVPSWWKNTHVKLIGWLFIIHYSNVFENKKGIIKVPVYSSVIDINFSYWYSPRVTTAIPKKLSQHTDDKRKKNHR